MFVRRELAGLFWLLLFCCRLWESLLVVVRGWVCFDSSTNLPNLPSPLSVSPPAVVVVVPVVVVVVVLALRYLR